MQAVRKISFEVERGKGAVALIGESGSGKTTVGLGLMRLLPFDGELLSGGASFTAVMQMVTNSAPPRDRSVKSEREEPAPVSLA